MTAPRYRWQPTTAEIAEAAGIDPAEVVRFDHNTSPFPTGWVTGTVAGPAAGLNEYPGASYQTLRESAARHAGVPAERVAVGAGADELLLLAGRAFLRPGSRAVTTTPTYPLPAIASHQTGADVVEIPATGSGFAFPLDEVLAAATEAEVTWLCVPDNPTGARLDDPVVEAVIDATPGVVVIDAAYAEIAGDDWSPWVARHPRLLVLHTLSKGFGLAGIRVGYGLGHPELVDAIDAVRPPGSIASISVEIAIAALADPGRMRDNVAAIRTGRHELAIALEGLGMRVLPSHTNFLLCEVGDRTHPVGEALVAEGLVPRMYPAGGPLGDYLRFTVRSPDENRRLVEALHRHLGGATGALPGPGDPSERRLQ